MTFISHNIAIDLPCGYLDAIPASFQIDGNNGCAVLLSFDLGKLRCDRKRAVLIMGDDQVIAAEAEAYEHWQETQAHWGAAYDRLREAAE